MLNIYVTSSSRRCGKTFITAGLAATMQSLGYTTSVYKPIQTSGIEYNGFMQSPDLTFVKTMDPYIKTAFSYLYKTDSEPLIASETENKPIDIELIKSDFKKISSISDCTILDGDGGILSPISAGLQNIDIILNLKLPLLIVTEPKEDSVNNTLTTIYTAREKGIEVRGVIINNITSDCSNMLLTSIPRVIEEYTDVNVVGLVSKIEEKNLTPDEIITSILNGIDIESVFNTKIEKLDMN